MLPPKCCTQRTMIFLLSLQISLFLFCTSAPQQQQNPNVDAVIQDIFQTNPAQQRDSRPQTSGFGTFVTPVPIDSSQPQTNFQSISGQGQCNCVPYHMCDPSTNTVTDDGDFDGFGVIDIRADFNEPVCEHFLDVCCADNRTRVESLNPKPQEERPNRPVGCGIRNLGGIDFNITGARDNEAGFGEFPWTIALLHASNYSYFCAASLIHARVVLTAAHCVIGRPVQSFLIRAGEWDSQTTKERLPYEERAVQAVFTHPQYNPRNVAFDFAVLILSTPLTLGDHINVVCLPGQNAVPAPGTSCLATGWGKDIFGAAGRYSTILKRVPLPIVDFGDCQQQLRQTRLGQRFALDRSFLCAGGVRGFDTCQGDGGAPMVCPIGISTQNRFQQNGIVAWGIGCNDNIPAAYANVALARSWIDQQMLANGLDTTSYSAF